jgi:RNA polymerase sigma factor for flagellar operon FliA
MAVDPHDLYRLHGTTIESAIAVVCRRFRLPAADAEDFAGEFRLRLVRENYATLRDFQGRSTMGTYLLVVITRAFQDWRNARWGKWRTSAEARRLGPLAERLERLVVRDGHSLDEAYEVLRTNLGFDVTRASLDDLAARFPVRHRRKTVGDEGMAGLAAPGAAPDADLAAEEAARVVSEATAAIGRALSRLAHEDQLILRMRFTDGLKLSEIARMLHLDQKPLYRRVEGLLLDLRRALEHEGLTAEGVATALAEGGFEAAGNRPSVSVQ